MIIFGDIPSPKLLDSLETRVQMCEMSVLFV